MLNVAHRIFYSYCNYRFYISINNKINLLKKEVRLKAYILESGSPLNNLKRGYALIYDKEGAVKHCDFTVGETAKILTFTQELECEVVGIKQRENLKNGTDI